MLLLENFIRNNKFFLFIFTVYIIVHTTIYVLNLDASPYLSTDSPTYIEPAETFYNHFNFDKMVIRAPIYPLFLALHMFIIQSSLWLNFVCFSQIILNSIGICLLSAILFKNEISYKSIIIFSIFMIFNPAFFYYESTILTESLSFFLLCLYIYILENVLSNPSRYGLIILSCIGGFLALLRADYLLIHILVILLLYITQFSNKHQKPSYLFSSTLPYFIIVSIWLLRNWVMYKFIGITLLTGMALFYNVYDSFEHSTSKKNEQVIKYLIELREKNPEKKGGIVWIAFHTKHDGTPRSFEEKVDYMKTINEISFKAVLAKPGDYLKNVLRSLYGIIHPALGKIQSSRYFGDWSLIPWKTYRIFHFVIFFLVTIFILFYLLFNYQKKELLNSQIIFYTLIFVSYILLVIFMINAANSRYRFPFDGIIITTGIISFFKLFNTFKSYSKNNK